MANLLKFNSFKEFYEQNLEHMEAHYYVYFKIINTAENLDISRIPIISAFNIIEDDKLIIALHFEYNYFLFSFGWTPTMLDVLVKETNFNKYITNFHFQGQRDLVLELVNKNKIRYQVYKERLVYECYTTENQDKRVSASVENASLYDIDELASMTLAYSKEEYPQNEEDIEKAYKQAHYGIVNKKMYIVKKNEIIYSILQVKYNSDSEYDRPIIGSLYTIPNARGKGYASLLLHTVTEGYLKEGFEVIGLLSDITNPASNKVFQKIGYKPIYHWIDIIVN